MDRWRGRVAVVTGASAGIGAAIAKDLVNSGMIVVGLARRKERIESLFDESTTNRDRGKLYALKCDLKNETDICDAFKWIEENLKRVDVLINNAATAQLCQIIDTENSDIFKDIIQINLTSVVLCTKKAVSIMKKMNINDGHIININSLLGHRINAQSGPPLFNVYPSTKYGITGLTEVLRQELKYAGTKIKVTSISPGVVNTEMCPEEFRKEFYENSAHLQSEDISNAVLYVLGTPPHVQVHELQIQAVGGVF